MVNYSERDRQRWLQASPTHNKIFQWIMESGTMCPGLSQGDNS
ncbi:hypothetical protein [Ligilactobacillus saerimneri]|nr:hypothetical protein [Ligilactobacillus saerimneri]